MLARTLLLSVLVTWQSVAEARRLPYTELAPAPGATAQISGFYQQGVNYISDPDFSAVVLTSPIPCLVSFYGIVCPNCVALNPALEQLAKDHAGKLRVVKMGATASPETAAAYQVGVLPTTLLFVKGQVVGTIIGPADASVLSSTVAPFIA